MPISQPSPIHNLISNPNLKRLFTAATLMALSACSSIPIMVPDMAMQSATPPTLEGARGPLSAEQSKKILAKILAQHHRVNFLVIHKTAPIQVS